MAERQWVGDRERRPLITNDAAAVAYIAELEECADVVDIK
jgi:hypothetical protein